LARAIAVRARRSPREHVVQHDRRLLRRARPVQRRRQRQRATRQRAAVLLERLVQHQRPGLVDQLVHELVDGAATTRRDQWGPLGDRPFQMF